MQGPSACSTSTALRRERGFAGGSLHHNPALGCDGGGGGGCDPPSSGRQAAPGSPPPPAAAFRKAGPEEPEPPHRRRPGERMLPASGAVGVATCTAAEEEEEAAAEAKETEEASRACGRHRLLRLLLLLLRRRHRGSPRPPRPPPPPRPPRPPLLRWDEVPEDFVECFILSGYRRLHCSAQECLASVVQPTNETLNFWTHFVPLLLFAGRLGRLLVLRGSPGSLPLWHPALLPLWCYASGVLLTLAMSCAAHVFSCLSPRLRAAFFYLDYASISYYGFASTVAYYYYLLPGLRLLEPGALGGFLQQRLGWQVDCRAPLEAYGALVLPVALGLALACTEACCQSRAQWCAYPFAVRTFVFVMPLSMACPIVLESLLFDLRGHNPTLFRHFYRRYFWLAVAAFFNVSKIPERIRPGLFDIVGHSHQLFHIFTFLSIYDQLFYVEEGLHDFLKRPQPALPTFAGTVGYMLLLILCLALVVRRFLNTQEAPCKED